jgi:preprotein translocase subunit SecG
MVTFLTILIALNCILLMGTVLIQNPKGGGVDSSFGGGAANQMFGAARSTDFVEKLTWILAAILFILCVITAVVVSGGGGAEVLQTEG